MGVIEHFLHEHPNAYIHFDLSGRGWHECEEVGYLNRGFVDTFFEKTSNGYVMSGFLFKTLATGTSRTPGFEAGREFRNRLFKDENDALDLLYGINYASRATIRKNDFKVIVLPRAQGLTAAQIERFFERRESTEPSEGVESAEGEMRANLTPENDADAGESDELLAFVEDAPDVEGHLQFDCIFSKAGGTKPDIDMIEITGIERSRLAEISRRVRQIRDEIQRDRTTFFLQLYGKPPKNEPSRITITGSFLKILGDPTRDKKKYQSHLFHVIPQIFNDNYIDDSVLLPAFIEKTEFQIRSDDLAFFNEAKFALAFLYGIRFTEKDDLMEMKEQSSSYQIGLSLGIMARPLRRKINSFDKNYAGLLSRRITTIADVKALANEINQKLILHEVLYPNVRDAWLALTETVKGFSGTYDKNECAFGFFESYFAPVKTTTDGPDAEPEQASDAPQLALL